MFNSYKNNVKLTLIIEPKSPLLIKGSSDGNLVKWNITAGTEEPFIPGSTLKGMLRELYNKIWYDHLKLESDKFNEIENLSPTNDDKVYDCEDYMEKILNEKGEDIFLEKSLKISKLFGAKGLKSRLHFSDAYFEKKDGKVEKKAITPIDSFTGGVIVPLTFEYTMDNFVTELSIKNADIDELKTLLFAIRDSRDRDVQIGSSKTRGFGEIEIKIKSIEYTQYGDSSNDMSEFTLNEKKSLKLGDKYLFKVYETSKNDEENFNILKKMVG